MAHFRKYDFENWDSTSVGQKCVVGHGLWDKNGYLHGFSVAMQYLNAVTVDGDMMMMMMMMMVY